MPHPAGYRKARRLMEYAERFGLPLVTLVDTPGAYPGLAGRGAQPERRDRRQPGRPWPGCASPMVSAVIGEGGSGGALALGVGDRAADAGERDVYSVISPEGCATILFGDAGAGAAARPGRCG